MEIALYITGAICLLSISFLCFVIVSFVDQAKKSLVSATNNLETSAKLLTEFKAEMGPMIEEVRKLVRTSDDVLRRLETDLEKAEHGLDQLNQAASRVNQISLVVREKVVPPIVSIASVASGLVKAVSAFRESFSRR